MPRRLLGRLTFRQWVLLWQVPFWLLVLLSYVLLTGALESRVQATRQATQTRLQSEQLASVLQAVVDMETSVRGFVIVGQDQFLKPYLAARAALPTALVELREQANFAGNGAVSPEEVDHLSELVTRWQSEVAEPEILARRQGNEQAAQQMVKSGHGKLLIDQIREQVQLSKERETQRLHADEAAAEERLRHLRQLLLLSGALLLLVSVAATLGGTGLMSRSFDAVIQAVGRLTRGEKGVRLTTATTQEFRAISLAFNQMTQQLEQAQQSVLTHAQDLATRNEQMRTLGELSDWMQAARSTEEGAEILSRALPTLLPFTQGRLLLFNASRNPLLPLVQWGEDSALLPTTPDSCWALRRGEARFPQEGRFAPPCLGEDSSSTPHDYICFPLFAHGETLGLLRISAQQDAPSTAVSVISSAEERRRLLVPLTRQVGLALSALQLQARLREQSLRDPLTGLANRRALEDALELALHQSASGQKVALVALDIDHFKRLNDTFGHDAGDAVLVKMGQVLRELTPQHGLAARAGGEEFSVVLPQHDALQASEWAERLRSQIESWSLSHAGIALGQITVSVGVSVPTTQETCKVWVKRADEALYAAKRGGRNRVVVSQALESVEPAGA